MTPIPAIFSAYDLLDAHINLGVLDPTFVSRSMRTGNCNSDRPILIWHYAALSALSQVFGTYFEFFGEEFIQLLPDKPGDWAEIKAEVRSAMGEGAEESIMETLLPGIFGFLVKFRTVQAHFIPYFDDDITPEGRGADYAAHLAEGLLASLDQERLAWMRALLVRVLDPAGRTFTAEQLLAAGYPERSWEDSQWEDEN